MDGLWTNRRELSDFVQNGIIQYGYQSELEVYIAVAFFTDAQLVKDMLSHARHIRMVVRLGFPTKPDALRALISNPSVELRYYSDSSFHPKLYIFGDKAALVGSANLTEKAFLSNQEIVVLVDSKDPRFNELASLFSNYWGQAQVLTSESLDAYDEVYKNHGEAINDILSIDEKIQSKIGKHAFDNILRGKKRRSKENIFLDTYRRTYQESVSAFLKIREVYETEGKRKNDFDKIPLRLEIDSFISWVRDNYATGEAWREQPRWNDDRKKELQRHIGEWLKADYPHYETICKKNYPLIERTFKSAESIGNSEDEQIVDALVVLHSFHDRLRFYPGGLNTLKDRFKQINGPEKIKSSLIHLLFGEGDIVRRMADLIYETYKLHAFGGANVQELVGWVNKEELPVINGRTTKVLRYYGFDVKQL